jgi:hypothetical protein
MLWAAVTPTVCLAQVQLPAVNLGDTNFEDAFGGPGWLLQEFPEGYASSELKDSNGKTQINGIDVLNSKESTVGLGPGLQLSGRDIWFRLNAYLETDVHDRPSGVKVTFRISKTVPTKEPQASECEELR